MILTEHPYKGKKKLIRTYSDDTSKDLLQVETGAVYTEAIDFFPKKYTYVEVDKKEKNDDALFV